MLDPAGYHGPAGLAPTDPADAGFAPVVIWYSVCHTHVIVELEPMVKVVVVPVPVAGTDPVPVHPVHTYRVPVGPATGEVTEAVTDVPQE
jgi:hypothetical protein